MLSVFLLMFALVLFLIAGFGFAPEPWRNRLVCFGLACMAAALLVMRSFGDAGKNLPFWG